MPESALWPVKILKCNCASSAITASEGLQIVEEFIDKGVSGSEERRPALDRLIVACRKRLVDGVVVYRYDRFARSLRQLVNALDEFRTLGIDFISLHEGCRHFDAEWTIGFRNLCQHRRVRERTDPGSRSVRACFGQSQRQATW